MTDAGRTPEERGPQSRRRHWGRWVALIVFLLPVVSLLWVSNWFYQRATLFDGADLKLAVPQSEVWSVFGDEIAEVYFGDPIALSIKDRKLTASQLRMISGYHRLERLGLAGLSDDDVNFIQGLTNLRFLHLYDSNLTDEGISRLKDLIDLDGLTIEGATLSTESFEVLSQLPLLDGMSFRNCEFQGDPFRPLINRSAVRSLGLNHTGVTDEMLDALAEFGALEGVFLHGTNVSREACLKLKRRRPDLVIGCLYDLSEAMPPGEVEPDELWDRK